MLRWILFVAIFLVSVGSVLGQCVEPMSGMDIDEDTTLCSGNYTLEEPLQVKASVVCDNTIISCLTPSNGLYVEGNDLTISGCTIKDCQNAIYLFRANQTSVHGNTFIGNRQGIVLASSFMASIEFNAFIQTIFNVSTITLPNELVEIEEIEELQEILPKKPKKVIVETRYMLPDKEESIEILSSEVELNFPDLSNRVILHRSNEIYDNYFSASQDLVEIERTVEYEGNLTRVIVTVVPKQEVLDFRLYEKIPKCFTSYLTEVVFAERDVVVLKDDPIVMWQLGTVDSAVNISYQIGKVIEKDCIALLRGMGISRGLDVEEDNNGFTIGLTILLLVTLLVVAYLFHRKPR